MANYVDTNEGKTRIIQELVPGKQITLAHIIANPDIEIYEKLGLDPADDHVGAIGIVTMTPSETAIIAADIATKSSGVELGFVARGIVGGTAPVQALVAQDHFDIVFGAGVQHLVNHLRVRILINFGAIRHGHPQIHPVLHVLGGQLTGGIIPKAYGKSFHTLFLLKEPLVGFGYGNL